MLFLMSGSIVQRVLSFCCHVSKCDNLNRLVLGHLQHPVVYTVSEIYTKLRPVIDCINGKNLGYALPRIFRINSLSTASFLQQRLGVI